MACLDKKITSSDDGETQIWTEHCYAIKVDLLDLKVEPEFEQEVVNGGMVEPLDLKDEPEFEQEVVNGRKVEPLDLKVEPEFEQNEEKMTASLPNLSSFSDQMKSESLAGTHGDDSQSFITIEIPPLPQPVDVYDPGGLIRTDDANGIPCDKIKQEDIFVFDNSVFSPVVYDSDVRTNSLYGGEAQEEIVQGHPLTSRVKHRAAGEGIQKNNSKHPEASINEDNTKETGYLSRHVLRRCLLKTQARKWIYPVNDEGSFEKKIPPMDVPTVSAGVPQRSSDEISVNSVVITKRVMLKKQHLNTPLLTRERPKKITRILMRDGLIREVIQRHPKGISVSNGSNKLRRSAKKVPKIRVLLPQGSSNEFLRKHKDDPNNLTKYPVYKKKRHVMIPQRPREVISINDDDDNLNESRESGGDVVTKQLEIEQENEIDLTNSEESPHERHKEEVESDSECNEECHNPFISFDKKLTSPDEVDDKFIWSRVYTFYPDEESFKPEHTGSIIAYPSGYYAFRSFWDDSVLELLVDKINKQASEILSSNFQSQWYPTNIHEVLCLFACWILMGIIKMPTTESCFIDHPLLNTDVFRRIFTFKRYSALIEVLNYGFPIAASFNNLPFAKSIFSNLNSTFKANYIPSKDVFIEEDLTCKRMRNVESEPWNNEKLALRMFGLRERATGYLWSFVLCAESLETLDPTQDLEFSKSTSIVKKLIEPIFNKGFKLHTDNWSNAFILAKLLKRNGTDYLGTLPPYSKCIPKLINPSERKEGQLKIWKSENVYISSWRDGSVTTMITTYTGSDATLYKRPQKEGFRISAPKLVKDFKKLKDARGSEDVDPYMLERTRTYRWFLKNFKRLLHCSVANAHILLLSSSSSVDFLDFRLNLVDAVLAHHQPHMAQEISQRPDLSTSSTSSSQHPTQGDIRSTQCTAKELPAHHNTIQEVNSSPQHLVQGVNNSPQLPARDNSSSSQHVNLGIHDSHGQTYEKDIVGETVKNNKRIMNLECYLCSLQNIRWQYTVYTCETCKVPVYDIDISDCSTDNITHT